MTHAKRVARERVQQLERGGPNERPNEWPHERPSDAPQGAQHLGR
jgi:hypothetical protein